MASADHIFPDSEDTTCTHAHLDIHFDQVLHNHFKSNIHSSKEIPASDTGWKKMFDLDQHALAQTAIEETTTAKNTHALL